MPPPAAALPDNDAWELLLHAVRSALPPEDQDRVLHTLLAGRSAGMLSLPLGLPHHVPKVAGSEEIGFLVRLPPDLHGEFRTWCKAHGFSMAVVIRGLVERFLVQQGVR